MNQFDRKYDAILTDLDCIRDAAADLQIMYEELYDQYSAATDDLDEAQGKVTELETEVEDLKIQIEEAA